ncbi:Uncharacterized protein dnm_046690 [Desulfonema magnum]|uniref:Uncharacterized protein n=1 Tax=Desulfonema magnum TaxID=45655 RepID=A0A975BNP9_9BACT|nr:Uncharacterized protein dnm_046690 [Desulfonema magnum]
MNENKTGQGDSPPSPLIRIIIRDDKVKLGHQVLITELVSRKLSVVSHKTSDNYMKLLTSNITYLFQRC